MKKIKLYTLRLTDRINNKRNITTTISYFLFRVIAIYLITLVAVSCNEDKLGIEGEVTLPGDTNLMALEAWSYEVPFEIKSDTEWEIQATGGVAYVHPEKGAGNASVLLCVVDNKTESRRDGELRVVFPKDESKNYTVKLQQKWEGDYDDNADMIYKGNQIYAVGYGYNTMGGYANPNSIKGSILKVGVILQNLKKDPKYTDKIALGAIQAQFDTKTYTASNLSDLSNKLSAKANLSGKYGKFEGEMGASFDMANAASSNHEYALTYADRTLQTAEVKLILTELTDTTYMTESAYNAINGLDKNYTNFKQLIKDYGTHLVLKSRLGGRVRHSMTVDISTVSGSYDLEAFAKTSYDGIFVSASGSVDNKFSTSYKNNTNNCQISVSVLGGETKKVLDLSGKLTAANFKAWEESLVNSENRALVGFDEGSLLPLYELVDKQYEDRAAALKSYMENGQMKDDFNDPQYTNGTVTKFTVPSFGNSTMASLVKDVTIDGRLVAQICEEFIPTINREKRVIVVYPVIKNQVKFNMGYFLGNDSYKPSRASWDGNVVTIKEYTDEKYAKPGDVLYIRGTSVTSSSTAVAKEGTVTDYTANTYGRTGSDTKPLDETHNYPIVKVLNSYWMRENLKSNKYHNGKGIGIMHFIWPGWVNDWATKYWWAYYHRLDAQSVAPEGWRVPTEAEYIAIKDMLVSNDCTPAGNELMEGGKTGMNFPMNGWYHRNNTTYNVGEFTILFDSTGRKVHIRKNSSTLEIIDMSSSEINTDLYSIRLIKK